MRTITAGRVGSRGLLGWMLLLMLLVATAVPGVALSRPGGNAAPSDVIHPALLQLMESQPNFRVPIIIQKAGPQVSSEKLAKAAGATVEDDFGFIQSLKITVPARAINGLSRQPGVRYISPDGPVTLSAIDTSALQTAYPQVTGAVSLWNSGVGLTGKGVTVAVVDSGVNPHEDFGTRLAVRWAAKSSNVQDANGHGTHVAGTIAGKAANGQYIGVAPESIVLSLKTANDKYQTSEAGVVKALQWVYENKATYNIRVVNMSISAQTPNSYLFSPMAAAAEKVWQSGVVVVAAAGNRGPGSNVMWYPPANDPFLITVGALDDNGTVAGTDDSIAPFSSYGTTQNMFSKPEVVAPGRKIVAPLASTSAVLAKTFPDRITPDGKYIRLSGTSMATPVVSGLVALMLERHPDLTPNQVKWALTQTTQTYTGQPTGTAGQANIQGALDLIAQYRAAGTALGEANQGLLWNPQVNLLDGSNTNWEATDWTLATSPDISTSAYWDTAYWDTAYWDTAYWDTAYWDTAYWDTAYWDTYYSETSYIDEASAMNWD